MKNRRGLKDLKDVALPRNGGSKVLLEKLQHRLERAAAELTVAEERSKELREKLVDASEDQLPGIAGELARVSKGLTGLRNGVERLRQDVASCTADPDVLYGVVVPSIRFSPRMETSGKIYDAKVVGVLEVHVIGLDQLVTVRLDQYLEGRYRRFCGREIFPKKEVIAELLNALRKEFGEGETHPFRSIPQAEGDRLKLIPIKPATPTTPTPA